MKILYCTGAYSRRATFEDWQAGKDFKIIGGPYFSNADIPYLKAKGFTHISFITLSKDQHAVYEQLFTVNLSNLLGIA